MDDEIPRRQVCDEVRAIGAGLLEGAALFDEAEDFGVGEEEEGAYLTP
jgi:hypothetical protein